MHLLIDNYDSFTYNLWHYLGELGAEVDVKRNDAVSVADVMAMMPDSIVLSPGPCDPDKAGICLDLVAAAAGKIPIFGVCLGFQTIGQAFGAKVVRAPVPMHGKLSTMTHDESAMFDGIENPFQATRYHSLMLERDGWPECLEVTASSEDGLVMALAHRTLGLYGVQFHPESIASEHGHRLLQNFINLATKELAPV